MNEMHAVRVGSQWVIDAIIKNGEVCYENDSTIIEEDTMSKAKEVIIAPQVTDYEIARAIRQYFMNHYAGVGLIIGYLCTDGELLDRYHFELDDPNGLVDRVLLDQMSGFCSGVAQCLSAGGINIPLTDKRIPCCSKCGVPYPFPLDSTLDRETIALIKIPERMTTVLCANCIARRAAELPGVSAARMQLVFNNAAQETRP